MTGRHPDELTATSAHADDLAMRSSRASISRDLRLPHANGSQRDCQVIRYPVLDPAGGVLASENLAFDITEQKRTIAALELARERSRSMFEQAPIGMAVLTLDARLEQVNDAPGQILSYQREQLEGRHAASLMHRDDLEAISTVRQRLLDGGGESASEEARCRHVAGYVVVVDVHLALLRDSDGEPLHFLAQVQDITERKRDHAHLAGHDPLTGVKNRCSFHRTLDRYASHERRRGSSGSLMVINLFQFKQINDKAFNDAYGHILGDQALIAITRALNTALHREGDMLARYGGEEFAAVLPDTNPASARHIANRLLTDARDVSLRQAPEWTFSVSIGSASWLPERHKLKAIDLLTQADRALYAVRESGRDRINSDDAMPAKTAA